MPLRVPFFCYSNVFQGDSNSLLEIIQDVASRGAFIMQEELENFEQAVAAFTGAKYAVGVANATDGLQMLLMAGGIKPSDEVIFCSHTMVATASAIYFVGATPVPVEAGSDHLIDPLSIEKAITDKTKAIIVTQLNGRTANMDQICAIANRYDLQIYEDAAQALGSTFRNRFAGTFGIGGCISFYPAKTLGCLGDGGIILSNDALIAEKIKLIRDHGRDKGGEVQVWGFNSRLDNIQAAILLYKFQNYSNIISRRREIAHIYQERLGGVGLLKLPPAPNDCELHFDIYQNYEIEAECRDDLKAYLLQNSIGTLIQWSGKAVHQFKKLGFTQSLPFTDILFDKLLMLPINMSVTNEDIFYVCEQINKFYQSFKR